MKLNEVKMRAPTREWKFLVKDGTYSTEQEKSGGRCPTCHRDGWRQFPETHKGKFPVFRYLGQFGGFKYFTPENLQPIIIEVGEPLTLKGKRVVPVEKIISGGNQRIFYWNPKPHKYDNWDWQAPNFERIITQHNYTVNDRHPYHVMAKDLK